MPVSAQMAIFIVVGLGLWVAGLSYLAPRVAPVSSKQAAVLFGTATVCWIPMLAYILFVVAPSPNPNRLWVGVFGFLNLAFVVAALMVVNKKWVRKMRR